MKQLEENPEMAAKMNELAFGPFAARQLAARDELIEDLVEALQMFSDNAKEAGDLFEDGCNSEAWEWLHTASIKAKATLAKARGEA